MWRKAQLSEHIPKLLKEKQCWEIGCLGLCQRHCQNDANSNASIVLDEAACDEESAAAAAIRGAAAAPDGVGASATLIDAEGGEERVTCIFRNGSSVSS